MKKEHIPEVAELEKECFSHPWSANSLEMLLDDNGIGIVACDGQKVVGYGGALLVLDEAQITDIAVKADFRRRGIGMEIVKGIITLCKDREISTVYLEVRESNAAARELYRSCGFEVCGVRKDFYKSPRESAILMKYQIKAIEL